MLRTICNNKLYSGEKLRKTIIPRLSGGLGNQLFQISSSYALAKDNDMDFAIDYEYPFTCSQGNHPKKYSTNLYSNIKHKNFCAVENCYEEKQFEFQTINIDNNKNTVLSGYFQSYKYFYHNIDKIKNILFSNIQDLIDESIDNFNKLSYVSFWIIFVSYSIIPVWK
jgi:hypothetical protein